MKAPPPLSTQVRWTLLGTAASAAGSWLLVIILARTSGARVVGSYAFALAIASPVMSFCGLQLRTLLVSDSRRRYGFREYRRLAALTAMLGAGVTVLAGSLVGREKLAWAVLLPVCAATAMDAISQIYWGLWQQHERMTVIGLGRVLQASVQVAAVLAACAAGLGAAGAAASVALGSATLLGYLHLRTTRDADLARSMAAPGTAVVDANRLWSIAIQGLPLGLILLLETLQSSLPRYFIERDSGAVALGLFAAASQLTSSGQLFVGALGSAALPRLASWHESRPEAFRGLTRRLVLIGVGLGVAGVTLSAFVGRQVLVLVYRPEFGEAGRLLVVLSLAAGLGFVASLLGYALTASRIIAVQPAILTATLGVIATSSVVLSPRFGAAGVAWALVVGAAVQVAANAWTLRQSHARRAAAVLEANAP